VSARNLSKPIIAAEPVKSNLDQGLGKLGIAAENLIKPNVSAAYVIALQNVAGFAPMAVTA
jgi:hypothetical protein